MTTRELRAKRAKLITDAQAMTADSNFTAEIGAQVDSMLAEADALEARIRQAERIEDLAADLGTEIERRADATGTRLSTAADNIAQARDLERRLFQAYALNDPGRLSDADRAILATRRNDFQRVQAAGGVGTNSAGGYTVAPDFMAELAVAMKAYGGVRQAARVIPTSTGVDMPWPTMDDTANAASIVAENTAGAAGTDLSFGSVTMKAWTYRSGYLPLSIELIQDSAFDFDSLVRDALALRFARGQNAHFSTGNGTSAPQGITVGASTGVTAANGGGFTTSVSPDHLIDLEHSVDPLYRAGAAFMMNDASVKVLRKLKDAENRPFFMPGYESRSADTILGYPVIVNQDMPTMAANAKSIAFGNFGNYMIRDVMTLAITRLNELFAHNGQVAFIAFMRTDGRIVSGGAPIKLFVNAAS